jgi:hypothetical protein
MAMIRVHSIQGTSPAAGDKEVFLRLEHIVAIEMVSQDRAIVYLTGGQKYAVMGNDLARLQEAVETV